jgi:hypothetical protein
MTNSSKVLHAEFHNNSSSLRLASAWSIIEVAVLTLKRLLLNNQQTDFRFEKLSDDNSSKVLS